MSVEITRAGAHRHVQRAESFHDEAGRPRNRMIATLGRADRPGPDFGASIDGLLRASSRAPVGDAAPCAAGRQRTRPGDARALRHALEHTGRLAAESGMSQPASVSIRGQPASVSIRGERRRWRLVFLQRSTAQAR